MKYLFFCILFIFTSCNNFHPVYSSSRDFEEFLSSIEIEEVETLESTELYHQLTRLFGQSSDTKYLLKLNINDNIATSIITKQSNVVKQNVIQICNYALIEKESGQKLTEGRVRLVASYDSSASPYTSFTHEKYTKHGVTKTTAEEIRIRLMLYFESHKEL